MKKRHVDSMGEELGLVFYELWKEVAWIHFTWSQYVELFGTRPSRIALLNEAAGQFFLVVHDSLLHDVMIHATRLTDPPKSCGKPNLTVNQLPDLIAGGPLKDAITALVEDANDKTEFCRDWRNRHIAHRDLDLALKRGATPLRSASREKVSAALDAIAKVLNAVEGHYSQSETNFKGFPDHRGAVGLLYVIDAGLRAETERQARIREHKYLPEDLKSRDL